MDGRTAGQWEKVDGMCAVWGGRGGGGWWGVGFAH